LARYASSSSLGRFAWGGGHERLPMGFRIASLVSIGIYTLLGLIALQRAGLAQLFPQAVATTGMWVIAGYLGLGILMNAISRSKPERYTMTPLVIVLCALAIIIASSPMPAASA
jgi:hypothetical protein